MIGKNRENIGFLQELIGIGQGYDRKLCGNCRGVHRILIGILWGVFFPRPHLEEVFTGNFLESPSRFFSRELKQNGVVFGSDVVLMGECVGEIKGLFQGHFENKKRPHIVQNGRCKVFIFCLSLEFHRLPNFAFFKGLDDARISQKQEKLFPLGPGFLNPYSFVRMV